MYVLASALINIGSNWWEFIWYYVICFLSQEEAGIVHGNIRCSSLQVASYTDSSFSVRLSDPGLPIPYTAEEWVF